MVCYTNNKVLLASRDKGLQIIIEGNPDDPGNNNILVILLIVFSILGLITCGVWVKMRARKPYPVNGKKILKD